jgi:hypothetical protein
MAAVRPRFNLGTEVAVPLTPDIPSYSTGLEEWDGTRPSVSDDLQDWRPIAENL